MSKKVKISDIPNDKTFDDYPEDTEFVMGEDEDDNWEQDLEED